MRRAQPSSAKRGEDGADDIYDRLVGMEKDFAVILAPDEADQQATAQFAASRLLLDAAIEAGAQEMQLGLAHGTFQTQQKPMLKRAGSYDVLC
ncbi:MAG: hypothetical protein EOQ39_34545 [Mesorhizobium sp.]|uniref:hypothetical protein n=1 Tax=Mesorhizobium sp. TaxID=1871066 RepID=UPI000FE58965|nr:hypothetical protein [Mesorhizobium sp.]RWA97092.1 MAG: hypothetical protein EOQ37_35315 [Mesorhizobium sp.]RWB09335.1 MAG: hypothetical protein EOQ39_34545 [Mesorhizobium sp.]